LKPDLTPVSKETRAVPGRVVTGTAMRLIMPTRVSTEFTAQPLTYFVRSLGLESSFHSRLARSTKLSKINHELRLSGSFSIFNAPIFRSDCPRNLLSPAASATRDEPFNYSATCCSSSTRITHFVDAFDSASPTHKGALLNSAGCIRRVAHPESCGTARIVWHSRPRLCINTHSSQPFGTQVPPRFAHTASGLTADC
jgi:hypothetical protein